MYDILLQYTQNSDSEWNLAHLPWKRDSKPSACIADVLWSLWLHSFSLSLNLCIPYEWIWLNSPNAAMRCRLYTHKWHCGNMPLLVYSFEMFLFWLCGLIGLKHEDVWEQKWTKTANQVSVQSPDDECNAVFAHVFILYVHLFGTI